MTAEQRDGIRVAVTNSLYLLNSHEEPLRRDWSSPSVPWHRSIGLSRVACFSFRYDEISLQGFLAAPRARPAFVAYANLSRSDKSTCLIEKAETAPKISTHFLPLASSGVLIGTPAPL